MRVAVLILLVPLMLGVPTILAAENAGDTPAMVRIEPGTFDMGSPETEPRSRSNETLHRVTITHPFLLGSTEITRDQWRAVMLKDPSYFPACGDCPVERVDWYDAVAFCNALSRRQGLDPAYRIEGRHVVWLTDSPGYRLPTEAEWEYACRAGTRTAYATGGCLTTDQANFNGYHPLPGCPEGMNRREPLPVAGFAPNAWGLYDMHGNVNEWCWDLYKGQLEGPAVDPRGPDGGEGPRVGRGGCWSYFGEKCRSANRDAYDADGHWDIMGLRVARTLVGEEDGS